MDKIKISLYEIFGYALPGTISLIALQILFCILNDCSTFFPESIQNYFILIIVAYFLGHANQSIGNLFHDYLQQPIINKYNSEIRRVCLKLTEKSLPGKKALKMLHNLAIKKNFTIVHIDTFIEREAFYRGSTIGFLLLTLILCLSLFCNDLNFIFQEFVIIINLKQKLALIVLSVIFTILFYKRYIRYLNYKISSILDLFLDI